MASTGSTVVAEPIALLEFAQGAGADGVGVGGAGIGAVASSAAFGSISKAGPLDGRVQAAGAAPALVGVDDGDDTDVAFAIPGAGASDGVGAAPPSNAVSTMGRPGFSPVASTDAG